MEKAEIIGKTIWDEYGIGNCPIFVNLFGKEIPFRFFQEHESEPSITDKMIQCVNEVLSINKSELETVKEMLWQECNFAFQVSDYGFEPEEGETDLEAHLKGFGISNQEDAYSKSRVLEIEIAEENDEFDGHYSEIKIDSSSDNLISIIVKNGKIIDFDDDGTYLGFFDKDEQHARKSREKTLG